MSLTQGAWAVAAQVLLFILPNMAVVPRDADRALGFGVIDLGGKASFHEFEAQQTGIDLLQTRLANGCKRDGATIAI